MITIIDYAMGNPGSIINMLKKIGVHNVVLSSNEDDILKAEKLILPGVGAFDTGMSNLRNNNIIQLLNYVVLEKSRPILGICLGMQLLGNCSEEGNLPGLGWVDFENIRFTFDDPLKHLKIPHMGWNTIIPKKGIPIVKGMDEKTRFYFVHSYHAVCHEPQNILMETFYGYHFASAVHKDNIYGVQFHPEKSHKYGMQLLKNFVECC